MQRARIAKQLIQIREKLFLTGNMKGDFHMLKMHWKIFTGKTEPMYIIQVKPCYLPKGM